MRVETSPNGLGKVLHMWQPDVDARDEKEHDLIAEEFVKVRHRESPGFLALFRLHLGTIHIVRTGQWGGREGSAKIVLNSTREEGG